MKKILTLALLTIVTALAACTPTEQASEKPVVTTSFYPLYFFTQEIGRDLVDLQNLTPAGVEPHDHELTPQDRMRIADSQLLILNGGNFESWGNSIEKNIATVRVAETLMTENDPHIWLSPKLSKEAVDQITFALKIIDPSHATDYQNNAETLKTRLDVLDQNYQDQLKNCAQTTIITSHDAFAYLARDYGFTQMPIAGVSPEQEPSAQDLVRLASLVKTNGITTIFFESLVSPKLSETLAQETGAVAQVLNPIEGLTDDEVTAKKNYFTEMEANLNNLKTALQCQL